MGVEAALEHIARFGFDPDELPKNLSLALGSADVTLLQMARAYAVLANGGYLIDPYFVERIEQEGTGVIYQAAPSRVCRDCDNTAAGTAQGGTPAPRVLDERNRYLMYSMMQDVIRSGTATKARELGRQDLAGKTGTTNDQRDAWFNGFNQHLVANTWVGFDDNSKLGRGEVGGRAALPAWMDFMREALKDVPDEEPEMPEDIVMLRIDPSTGLLADAATEDAIFEVFRAEDAPGAKLGAAGSDNGVKRRAVKPPPTQDLF